MGNVILNDEEKGRYRQYSTVTDHFLTPDLTKVEMLFHLVLDTAYGNIPGIAREAADEFFLMGRSEPLREYEGIAQGEYYRRFEKEKFFSDWKEVLGQSLYQLIRSTCDKRLHALKKVPEEERSDEDGLGPSVEEQISRLELTISSLDELMGKPVQ